MSAVLVLIGVELGLYSASWPNVRHERAICA
jgi:hypothetical protein